MTFEAKDTLTVAKSPSSAEHISDILKEIVEQFKTNYTMASTASQAKITIETLLNWDKTKGSTSPFFLIKNYIKSLRDYYLIRFSKYFDLNWYKEKYLTVLELNNEDPVKHYLSKGAELGYDPSPKFSTNWYLKNYTDVKLAGVNPLLHFITHGQKQGRLPRRESLGIDTSKQYVRGQLIELPQDASNKDNWKTCPVFNSPATVYLHCQESKIAEWVLALAKNIGAGSKIIIVCQNQQLQEKIKLLKYVETNDIQYLTSSCPNNPLLALQHDFKAGNIVHNHICFIHDQLTEHPMLAKGPALHDMIYTLLGYKNLIYYARNSLNQLPQIACLQPMPMLEYYPTPALFWINKEQLKLLSNTIDTQANISNLSFFDFWKTLTAQLEKSGFALPFYKSKLSHWVNNYHSQSRPYSGISTTLQKEIIYNYKKSKQKKNKIVVYTAISNNYDQLKIPEVLNPDIDYVCFCNTELDGQGVFDIRNIDYRNPDPVKIARYIKTHPHTLLKNYKYAIWIDSNILLKNDLSHYLNILKSSNLPLGMIPHPCRENIAQEALAAVSFSAESIKNIASQISRYSQELIYIPNQYETGFIVFDLDNSVINNFLDTWWSEIEAFCSRDQLSLGYALTNTNLKVAALMSDYRNLRNSEDFVYFDHGHNNGYGVKNRLVAKEIL